LLRQFAVNRDQAAFAMLVERHGPMVLGICRRVLRDSNDAEDAFQATFLVLVRKARSIGKPELLGNWLYGVAMRTAYKARSLRFRRAEREAPLPEMETADDSTSDWELSSALHDEVNRLPAKYRAPVVLCYFEGQSNEEAARTIGCPTGTVQSRLAWARQRLRHRLAGQGFLASATAVALENQAAPAHALTNLTTITTKAALQYAGGTGLTTGIVSGEVAALTQGVLRTMYMLKVKTALAVVLVLLLAGAFAGVMARPSLANPDQLVTATTGPLTATANDTDDDKPSKKKDSWATVKEEVSKSFRTGNKPTLVVELFNGGIEVVAGDEASLEVNVTKQSRAADEEVAKEGMKKIEVAMTQEGDTVHIKASHPQEQHPPYNLGASARIRVPPGAALDLNTSNGQVTLTGGTGRAKIKTANGQIKLKDHTGAINVHTSNGPIEVTKARGPLELHTSNGEINVQTSESSVHADTSNGTIQFKGTLADGEHVFKTSNGNVQIVLPKESQFKINASTSHGRITSAFSFTTTGKGTKTHVEGQTTENAPISLKVHTSNGNIKLENGEKRE
jgi:RNA polymerase sigma factor (sigma-70 family)